MNSEARTHSRPITARRGTSFAPWHRSTTFISSCATQLLCFNQSLSTACTHHPGLPTSAYVDVEVGAPDSGEPILTRAMVDSGGQGSSLITTCLKPTTFLAYTNPRRSHLSSRTENLHPTKSPTSVLYCLRRVQIRSLMRSTSLTQHMTSSSP